jgi:hypothetical protein
MYVDINPTDEERNNFSFKYHPEKHKKPSEDGVDQRRGDNVPDLDDLLANTELRDENQNPDSGPKNEDGY